MQFAVESYSACEAEMRLLYPRHWAELATDKTIPLEPNYAKYRELDAAGLVLLVTARDDGMLVGYYVGFVLPSLHYSTTPSCHTDMFFVMPEWRGEGLPGLKLFRCVEAELRRRGIVRWYAQSKLHRDTGILLRRLGFRAVETHYEKRLA